jgi:hypothetical protein
MSNAGLGKVSSARLNEKVVHTGFYPVSHYLLALACHRRGT